MKKCNVYKPNVRKEQKGNQVVKTLVNKRGTLLKKDIPLMDRTLLQFEDAEDEFIIDQDLFIEEVKEEDENQENAKKREEIKKRLSEMSEDELIELAIENEVSVKEKDGKPSIIDNLLKKGVDILGKIK